MSNLTLLQKGSQGADVEELQTLLKNNGYVVDVDGKFGVQTALAVKNYKIDMGLDANDKVDEKTWTSLRGSNKTTSNTNATNQTVGSGFNYDDFKYNDYKESDIVKQAQDALNTQLANKPGAYESQWQTQLNDIMDKIMNREDFSYDLNGDALYQQMADEYSRRGNLAMMDTMGQAAAMTGGFGNSYAQSVGQQAYQAHLQELNEVIPELYQMALDKYNQEGQELYNQYSMLGAEEERDYGRYRDTVNDWLTERDYLANRYDSERDYDYSKYNNERDFAYGQYSDDKSYAYQDYRDKIEDAQWQANFDEAQRQYDESLKFQREQASKSVEVDKDKEKDKELDPPKTGTEDLTTPQDWGEYLGAIRADEGAAAAEAELSRAMKAGEIPREAILSATRAARGGTLGH